MYGDRLQRRIVCDHGSVFCGLYLNSCYLVTARTKIKGGQEELIEELALMVESK